MISSFWRSHDGVHNAQNERVVWSGEFETEPDVPTLLILGVEFAEDDITFAEYSYALEQLVDGHWHSCRPIVRPFSDDCDDDPSDYVEDRFTGQIRPMNEGELTVDRAISADADRQESHQIWLESYDPNDEDWYHDW